MFGAQSFTERMDEAKDLKSIRSKYRPAVRQRKRERLTADEEREILDAQMAEHIATNPATPCATGKPKKVAARCTKPGGDRRGCCSHHGGFMRFDWRFGRDPVPF